MKHYIPTIAALSLQLIVLVSQLIIYLSRPQDIKRKRFLFLLMFFLIHNLVVCILPSSFIPLNNELQEVLTFLSGLVIAFAYFDYLTKELELPSITSKMNLLMLPMLVAFILGFVVVLIVRHYSGNTTKLYLAFLPLIVVVYFFLTTLKHIRQVIKSDERNKSHKLVLNVGLFVVVLIGCSPLLTYLGDVQLWNISLANLCLLLAFCAYSNHYIHTSREEYHVLEQAGFFRILTIEDLRDKLTRSQFNIALLLLAGKDYKEIGAELHISEGTCRKHGSNIFDAMNVRDQKDFRNKYSYLLQEHLATVQQQLANKIHT